MSVTKLKTVGSWHAWRENARAERSKARGRVITGMLTGADDVPAVAETPEPPKTSEAPEE